MAETATDHKSEDTSRTDDVAVVLELLTAVEQNENITQRNLSVELNIALGLVNAYIKRLARKGYLKVKLAPLNRYSYYLTPKGFAEKARLTTEYLSISLTFFRQARRECTNLLDGCARVGWRRLALAGIGDLAEIATLCTSERIQIVAVIAPGHAGETFAGMPVVDSLAAAGEVDAILLTELQHPQATYDALILEMDADRVLAPSVLRIVRPATEESAAGDEPGQALSEAG